MEGIELIIFFTLFTALSCVRLYWALVVIVFLLPLYIIRFSLGSIPSSLLEGMILIVTGVWLIQKRKELFFDIKEGIRHHHIAILETRIFRAAILFLIAASVSTIISSDIRAALGALRAYFFEPVLFFLIFISLVKTPKKLTPIIVASILSGLSIALLAVYQKITGWNIPEIWMAERRVTSLFPYPNAVGLYLAPIIPLLCGWYAYYSSKTQGWKKKGIWFVSSIIFFVFGSAIFFAKTEAALLVVTISLFGWALFFNKKTRQRALQGIALCIFVIVISQPLQGFLKEKIFLQDWSGYVRRTVWTESIPMLKDHPITGAGLSGYKHMFTPYHTKKFIEVFLYPHNIILNFWTETGLYGLIAFLLLWITSVMMLVQTLKNVWTHHDDTATFLNVCAQSVLVSYSIIVIHGLVDVPYFKNDLSVFFWMLIAISFVLYTLSKSYEKKLS